MRGRHAMEELTPIERKQVADLLAHQANEVAGYLDDYRRSPGRLSSVELALNREIDRLRALAERMCSPAGGEG